MKAKYNLQRYVIAQNDSYEDALCEIKDGYKSSCWMWWVFPQLKGLGKSETAKYYGLADITEARLYLAHPILGRRLLEITEALLSLPSTDAEYIMGYPDNIKLMSCMTLFAMAAPDVGIFKDVLNKFFNGEYDEQTIRLLNKK